MTGSLTNEDVAKLLTDPSSDSRVKAAAKIAASFSGGELTERERKLAEEIFHIMLSDAEVRVRKALSENLQECPAISHEIAKALASDVDQVALPLLQFSDVLNDQDLLEIIDHRSEEKQIAISQRTLVSEQISTALIDTNNENVVASLIANEGAQISHASFDKAADNLGDVEKVQLAMIGRSSLPISVAEKLVSKVSQILCDELMKTHELTPDTAADLLLRSRERATVTLSRESADEDVQKLVKQLHRNGRLTSSLVIRAMCMGDLRFFESALSELAHIPLINAHTLIYDPGRTGLQRLWLASGMPVAQLAAVFAALDAASELEYNGEAEDRQRYSRRLMELVLTQYDDPAVVFESGDLEYLLAKISDLPSGGMHVD